jgi:putative oxidoreductase
MIRPTVGHDLALLVLRVALGATFIVHGYPKLFPNGPAGFAGFLQSLGFPIPMILAWIVSIVEFAGGIAMILGLFVRYVGALLVIEMTVTTIRVKMAGGTGFVGARGAGWELDALLWAMALALVLLGAGPFSLDGALGPRRTGLR